MVATTLEETSELVLSDEQIHEMLKELMEQEETNSQIRLALHDTRRALRFLRRNCAPATVIGTKENY